MRPALSVTSECAPLVKTGGLADVAGALPMALAEEGWDLRTLLPGYPKVLEATGKGRVVMTEDDLFGGPASVRSVRHEGLRLYILDAPHLYDRDGGPYSDASGADWPDNPARFAALSWVAARIGAEGLGKWTPEVLHAHDWQAGFAALYLSEMGTARPGTVLTIHNMAFHGLAPASARAALRLPARGFGPDGYEFWSQISALKAGLVWSDKITTVSPSYARELLTPEFGAGMDGLLRARADDLSGILNGIDTETWNPATDPAIENYKSPGGKKRARAALREEFGLPEADGPLCVVVSRLSDQKGLDILLDALPALVDRGGQLALLGSGDKTLEARYRAAAEHPNVAVHIGYDEALSHRMIAGADAILVPSRFEPCGLTQLYGLRYGAVPIVAYTGGLIDTVIPASPMAMRAGVATGIQFHPATAHALAGALIDAVALYKTPGAWADLQKNGMRQQVGWQSSAPAYAALYDSVARR
ncbi:glycogen synthase GlgA [Ovoidimarina sediminis]|uniref:glycogen synthase GlgA n=1 Tax=Ovoidimarina sediminis TaxID=3079856 RepID=UPI00290EC871|nr:glycogen synthase GlgA [Rhodophyticola sp. MJ-SS7]MDU8942750.1 glycogen synthase GlgA [Rhodophyticola sp. MJ-SS7]